MKRRTICAVLAVCLLCLLAACGKEKSGVSLEDLSLTVGGNVVTASSDVPELLEAFGDGYTYAEAVSCVYTGMDKTYLYPDVSIYTYPDGKDDRLMEIYCTADVTTAKGVAIGATLAEVEQAYGKDYHRMGDIVAYELPTSGSSMEPASLYFELDGSTVMAIAITTEHRTE